MDTTYYMDQSTTSAVEYLSRHFDVSPEEIIAKGIEMVMALQQARVQGFMKLVFLNDDGEMLSFDYELG